MVLATLARDVGRVRHRPDRPFAVPVARARRRARSAACRASGCSTIRRSSCSSASAPSRDFTRRCSRCARRCVSSPSSAPSRKPKHKGKVERAIRYLRDRFLAGRTITGVDRRQSRCSRGSSTRSRTSVRIRRSRSAPSARCSPTSVPGCCRFPIRCPRPRASSRSRSTRQAFIHVDTNRYSVPSDYASRVVTLVVDDRTVRAARRQTVVAGSTRGRGVADRSSRSPSIARPSLPSVVPHATSRVVTDFARWSLRSTASSSAGTCRARVSATASRGPSSSSTSTATTCSPPPPRTSIARGLSDVGALAVACEKHRKDLRPARAHHARAARPPRRRRRRSTRPGVLR